MPHSAPVPMPARTVPRPPLLDEVTLAALGVEVPPAMTLLRSPSQASRSGGATMQTGFIKLNMICLLSEHTDLTQDRS